MIDMGCEMPRLLDLGTEPKLLPITKTATFAAQIAHAEHTGDWIAACGGTETPFTSRTGRRLLYVWQPKTGNHAYLDLGTDLILDDAEAQLAMGMT